MSGIHFLVIRTRYRAAEARKRDRLLVYPTSPVSAAPRGIRSVKLVQDVEHLRTEPAQFVAVHDGELLEHASTRAGEEDALTAQITRIGGTVDETRLLGAIDQLDDGMVSELQRFGEIADDRRLGVGVATNSEQELVL
jgi:hypothetical protein